MFTLAQIATFPFWFIGGVTIIAIAGILCTTRLRKETLD